jgi:pantoate kinase
MGVAFGVKARILMKASVFVPAHISGFFQPCFSNTPERTGSRNCGPCLDVGVVTEVEAERADRTSVRIFIDGRPAPEAETTSAAVGQLLQVVRGSFKVGVNHRCQIPVGAGYGASGAGALGAAVALSKALGLRLSMQRLVTVAHVAEVRCSTGLGDVGAQAYGGMVIGMEPGAPPYGRWKRIAVPAGVKVVCATLGQISTKDILRDAEFRMRAEKLGKAAIDKILKQPDIENAVSVFRGFSEKLGLFDDELKELASVAEAAGAIGASQAMIGRAVFAFASGEKVESVRDKFLEVVEPSRVMVAGVYGRRMAQVSR